MPEPSNSLHFGESGYLCTCILLSTGEWALNSIRANHPNEGAKLIFSDLTIVTIIIHLYCLLSQDLVELTVYQSKKIK